MDKKGFLGLKFVIGLILTFVIFFYSLSGIAELMKVVVPTAGEGNFGDLVKEIKNLAEEGEDGEIRSFEVKLGTSLQDRAIFNFWTEEKLILLIIIVGVIFILATSGRFLFPQILNIIKVGLPFLTKFIGI